MTNGKPAQYRFSIAQTDTELFKTNMRYWDSTLGNAQAFCQSREDALLASLQAAPAPPDSETCPDCQALVGRDSEGRLIDDLGKPHFHGCNTCLSNQIATLTQSLSDANRVAAMYSRVCPCGVIVTGDADHPCDKCGEVGGELLEVAYGKIEQSLADAQAVIDRLATLLRGRLDANLCTANATSADNNILCRSCWTHGPMPKEIVGHSWQTVPHKPGCPWGEISEAIIATERFMETGR